LSNKKIRTTTFREKRVIGEDCESTDDSSLARERKRYEAGQVPIPKKAHEKGNENRNFSRLVGE